MKNITVEELKMKMDAGEKIHLLDVRENDERAEYNIGGTHVPLGKIQSLMLDDIEDWNKGDEIIIYCRSGKRSGTAALFLEQLGFTNTENLVGGMNAWKERIDK